jgi:flagellar biosynthesis/type III secretory pathway protein FliH
MGLAHPSWPVARPRARVVAAPVVQAQALADQMVEEARTRAAELLQQAESARQRSFEELRQTARAEALSEAQRALVEVQCRGTELLDSARTRAMVVELAVAIARRVLGEAWSAAPEQWAGACAEAIEPLRQARGLTLRVAPGRASSLRRALQTLLESTGRPLEVRVEEDSAIREAGCVAEAECGRVDGRLSVQLAALRAVLLEAARAQPTTESQSSGSEAAPSGKREQ